MSSIGRLTLFSVKALSVAAQEELIDKLVWISRQRALTDNESDMLALLLQRADHREKMRRWRLTNQRARAEARLRQLSMGKLGMSGQAA